MSNDDIVMANYSMLLEVYFLFMDINLSLSGISLALLCVRRDLKEETYSSNVKEQEYRLQTLRGVFTSCEEAEGNFTYIFFDLKHF